MKRFYFEVYYNFLKDIPINYSNLAKLKKKLFVTFFQLNSLKASFLSLDYFNVSMFGQTFYFSFNLYRFNIFFHFLYKLFYEDSNFSFSENSFNILNSSDLFLKLIFDEFLIRYSFLKSNLLNFKTFSFFYFRGFFVRRSKMYSLDIFPSRLSPITCIDKNYRTQLLLKLSLPIVSILCRIQTLGFLHSSKFRPVAFIKYVFSEDFIIIRFFSSFLYFILAWFEKLDNFFNLNVIYNLLKASLFLTLSRKHKKSLSWSYSLYTKNILYFRSISKSFLTFPVLFDNIDTSYSSFFSYIPFVLNEFFFISL